MKTLIIAFLLLFSTAFIYSQVNIPEGGFDNWSPNETGTFEEPTGGWWTSLNSLKSLGAPVTVSKTTDAHSGFYAARLESVVWGTFLIPGLLVSGKFEPYAPFVYRGKPFTEKPLSFKGFYKYLPVETDSAAIFAMLTKFNTTTLKKDTIAEAKMAVLTTVADYTAFDIPFIYFVNDVTPDSIDVVFSSSAAGESFEGFSGSVLFIDGVSLDYESGADEILMSGCSLDVFPNPATHKLLVETDAECKNLSYCLHNVQGNLVISDFPGSTEQEIDVSAMPSGNYLLLVKCSGVSMASRKFEIIR
ncbi:MAG: hypothetical protein A2W91_19440 [Bacteroidetes bacterium GWF2_38_335]|nr:MAG: hypothetical protein A2W91_19440 [Bacteroidetes bacterium GWF2_38_335]OFY79933.1 MAG: hypothetical protein A2281_10840 [Bacteroidetes bacterium RIFOXYA12_FULL_38_20]HBS86390.1 hypothetical protein [Bacteroidales bacterium]